MPYAENNRIKIFYDTYGTGTPIVFLHPRFIGILLTLAGRRATRESSLGGLFLVLIARPLRLLTLLANDSAGSLS